MVFSSFKARIKPLVVTRIKPLIDKADRWLLSPPKTFLEHLRQNLVIGLAIILFLSVAQNTEFVKHTREQSLDWLIQINRGLAPSEGKNSRPFVFYDIDEKTYELWGEPFHIPRDKLAQLISVAAKSHPAQIIVDVELDRPSGADDVPLVDALRKLEADSGGSPLIIVKGFKLRDAAGAQPYLEARTSFMGKEFLAAKKVRSASPIFEVEQDGQVRYWRPWQSACDVHGKPFLIPSVQLSTLAMVSGPEAVNNLDTLLAQHKPPDCWSQVTVSETLMLGTQSFHLDQNGFSQRILFSFPWRLRDDEIRPEVSFRGVASKALQVIPAYTVTEGGRSVLAPAGHIAVIGASFRDSRDLFETPLGLMPGSLILINAIESMVQHGQLRSPPLWVQLLSGSILLLFVSALYMRFPSLLGTVVSTIAIVIILVPLSMVFYRYGIWLDAIVPIIAIKGFNMIEQYREKKRGRTNVRSEV